MSKVTDALKRAEEAREQARANIQPDGTVRLTGRFFQALKEELMEEFRAIETKAPQAPAPTPSQKSDVKTEPSKESINKVELKATEPVKSESSQATQASTPWEKALDFLKQQLQNCELQKMQAGWEHARLTAQLAALDQLIVQSERDRANLWRQLEEASQNTNNLESTRQTLMRQWEALSSCQTLIHDIAVSERELEANGTLLAKSTETERRLNADKTRCEEQGKLIEDKIRSLRTQLAQTLTTSGLSESV